MEKELQEASKELMRAAKAVAEENGGVAEEDNPPLPTVNEWNITQEYSETLRLNRNARIKEETKWNAAKDLQEPSANHLDRRSLDWILKRKGWWPKDKERVSHGGACYSFQVFSTHVHPRWRGRTHCQWSQDCIRWLHWLLQEVDYSRDAELNEIVNQKMLVDKNSDMKGAITSGVKNVFWLVLHSYALGPGQSQTTYQHGLLGWAKEQDMELYSGMIRPLAIYCYLHMNPERCN